MNKYDGQPFIVAFQACPVELKFQQSALRFPHNDNFTGRVQSCCGQLNASRPCEHKRGSLATQLAQAIVMCASSASFAGVETGSSWALRAHVLKMAKQSGRGI
eukprot:5683465-Amphidinium_carterae.3